jgi:3-oxoadipate enol-lactonase
MATATVNGIEMYYEAHGPSALPASKAEPLLLIMGLGANATSWERQVPDLSREYQVIAFDNRGAGRSEKPMTPYTMPQMADDAAALLDHLGVDSAHVFGMSMGGMIAQELVLNHPQRVRSLILGATMAGGPRAVIAGPQLIQQWASSAMLPPMQAIENGLRFLYSDEFIAQNKERLVARALSLLHLQAPLHALQRQLMAVVGFNAHSRLGQIRCPTLVATGTDDKIIPAVNSHILAEGILDAELVRFEGAGHGFIAEKAKETNAAVLDFLSRNRSDDDAAPG